MRDGRGERGEVLPLLILWPAVVVLMLVLAAQAFLVTGARAQAEAAASAGLRAGWAAVGGAGLAHGDDGSVWAEADPHPRALSMSAAAHDAAARAAGPDGWRWWTPAAVTVRSDWCHSGADAALRPGPGDPGWVRVEVSGEVFGPFSALWPGRADRVHAAAAGPAVLAPPGTNAVLAETSADTGGGLGAVPAGLPAC